MNTISKSAEERLINIFFLWYQVAKPNQKLSSVDIVNVWTNYWFAKGDQQKIVDKLLKQFEDDIEICKEHIPTTLHEKMGMIILYDQIPRNIFRMQAQSYDYEHISLPIALELAQPQIFTTLPLQFQLTVTICIVHSEKFEHLSVLDELFKLLSENPLLDQSVKKSLSGINRNHYDRISMFGRIPERNACLGRVNTHDEEVYLQSLY